MKCIVSSSTVVVESVIRQFHYSDYRNLCIAAILLGMPLRAEDRPPDAVRRLRTQSGSKNTYDGRRLSYWIGRADYRPWFRNPFNPHSDDGSSERLKAISALGHLGAAAVPKLRKILKEPNRKDVEKWRAVSSLGSIGPDAKSAGSDLLAYATAGLRSDLGVRTAAANEAVKSLAAIGASDASPQLIKLFIELSGGRDILDAEQHDVTRLQLLTTIQILAKPQEARALIPVLEAIVGESSSRDASNTSGFRRAVERVAEQYLQSLKLK